MKTALITGAGSGIGKSTALALLEAGYAVVLTGRRREALESTASEAPAGASVRVVPADDQGRMVAAELPDLDPADGPVLCCAQAGEVNTGAFDPFDPIADWVQARRGWLHVDGAFGLWALADPGRAALVAGLPRADSLATVDTKSGNIQSLMHHHQQMQLQSQPVAPPRSTPSHSAGAAAAAAAASMLMMPPFSMMTASVCQLIGSI